MSADSSQNGGRTFLQNFALLATIVVGIFTVILPLYASDPPVDSQVQKNQEQLSRFDERLDQEKICSESSPEYCQALFERLSVNITEAQRIRLACAVISNLDATTVQIAPGITCPPRFEP